MESFNDNFVFNEVFEKYVVAYIDILGFSDFIKKAERVGSKENVMFHHFLDTIKIDPVFQNNPNHDIFCKNNKVVCRHISDSFIITAPYLEKNKYPALIAVSIKAIQIFQALLSINLAARGGIAIGNLCIKDNNIFGTAFINAYETESVKAIYPRILLHESAINELDSLREYQYRNDAIFAKLDKDIFLDSFFDLTMITSNSKDIKTKIKEFRDCIQTNLKGILDAHVRSKWIWIAIHFNNHLDYYDPEETKINIHEYFPIQINYLNP